MTADAQSHPSVALRCTELIALTTGTHAENLLLIDLRTGHRFRRGHIGGSHSIPSGLLLSGELPEGDLILISEQPQEAEAVVDALHASGYHQRLRYLADGLVGWRERGLPLQASEDHRSSALARGVLPGLTGTALLFAAAHLTSLPLLGLGTVLLWRSWIEPILHSDPRLARWI